LNLSFDIFVFFIVTGANALNHYSLAHLNTIPSGSLKFQWPTKTDYINGGFLMIQANSKSMTINFIKSSLTTVLGIPIGGYTTTNMYSKVIYPRE
jgi:hypothetical protein